MGRWSFLSDILQSDPKSHDLDGSEAAIKLWEYCCGHPLSKSIWEFSPRLSFDLGNTVTAPHCRTFNLDHAHSAEMSHAVFSAWLTPVQRTRASVAKSRAYIVI